ncbi:hypothetical protein PILCRDRAFT_822458 [Piloderma croceum F 1598]|uniref:Uncharacterized protein n=1 Tax=Piloderma croceum (strain F 1598) TaxID=765440 RepID=A0A0C3FK82_PILCF|nr:hypothetical protein PILCRDRAFT_822458 [Piloderma croceum F 1598]
MTSSDQMRIPYRQAGRKSNCFPRVQSHQPHKATDRLVAPPKSHMAPANVSSNAVMDRHNKGMIRLT